MVSHGRTPSERRPGEIAKQKNGRRRRRSSARLDRGRCMPRRAPILDEGDEGQEMSRSRRGDSPGEIPPHYCREVAIFGLSQPGELRLSISRTRVRIAAFRFSRSAETDRNSLSDLNTSKVASRGPRTGSGNPPAAKSSPKCA